MRVAPADLAVRTRVYYDLTGTLPGIPVGIAWGQGDVKKIVVPNGEGL